jgi:hypothetical protein
MLQISPMCPHLNSNLEDIKESILYHNWDWMQVNWGIEGAGKSKLSLYTCAYVDPTFNIKRVVFDINKISEAMRTCRRGQAILIDEGGEWLFNRNWNTKESKEIIQTLFVIRQRGLFIWINVPDIEILDVYVRSGRVRSGTKVWTISKSITRGGVERHFRERGFFNFYSRRNILNYFKLHWKKMSPSFRERYPNIEDLEGGVDLWKEYNATKDAWLEERDRTKEVEEIKEDKVFSNAKIKRLGRGYTEAELAIKRQQNPFAESI